MLRSLCVLVGLGLGCGCLATLTAHDNLVRPDDTNPAQPEPRSVASKAAFYVALPACLAIDLVTSPFQFIYVVTRAR
jgi:hypothetical protein